ncbi:MAG: hypothetical protein PIR53_02675 [Nocardioides alkalitolerans]
MTTLAYGLEAKFGYELDQDEASIIDFLDKVVDHLEGLDSIHDATLYLDEEATRVIVQLLVIQEGASVETAVGIGMGAVRAAFHACEGGTAGWPKFPDLFEYVNVTPEMVPASPELQVA